MKTETKTQQDLSLNLRRVRKSVRTEVNTGIVMRTTQGTSCGYKTFSSSTP